MENQNDVSIETKSFIDEDGNLFLTCTISLKRK